MELTRVHGALDMGRGVGDVENLHVYSGRRDILLNNSGTCIISVVNPDNEATHVRIAGIWQELLLTM